MAGDVWEPETVEFITQHCEAGDVITAGAWAGDSLPAFSQATSPRGRVWAFEPHPDSFRCCTVTVLLNDLKNVQLVNAGLGEKSDVRHLVVRDLTGIVLGGASHIVDSANSDGKRGDDTVPINIVAIDDLVPDTAHVSVLQLDIEGFEEFALVGAVKTIKRCRPFIILETVPKLDSVAGRLLQSLEYRITRPLDSENVLLECR
jgi:FkbM family methyltransferase